MEILITQFASQFAFAAWVTPVQMIDYILSNTIK